MKFLLLTVTLIVAASCVEISQRCLNDFNKCVLKVQNKMRVLHQVAPFTEDDALKTMAFEYSAKMARENKFLKNPLIEGLNLGENLGSSYNSKGFDMNKCGVIGKQYAEMWYEEIQDYNFGKSSGRSKKN